GGGRPMPGMISKQPNGLYCRISTVVEAPTDWDMTKEELRALLVDHMSLDSSSQTIDEWLERYEVRYEDARDEIRGLNMTAKEVREWLVSVGDKNADQYLKENAYRWEEEEAE
ncbi:hypothetical protein, partial [Listeria ivanovii]|uniref:hypothetical protein n=1 Tax=Listeria ivanovii TaxID=1638 RepID=UPI0030BA21D0